MSGHGRSAPRPGWWWQGVVLALVLVGGLVGWLHPRVLANAIGDADAGWHLATGRLIVETGGVPDADPFCFTSDGLTWTNLNWLAQVALYVVFLAAGFAGPLALASVLSLWTLGALVVALRRRGANPLWACLALLPLLAVLTDVHGLRPRGWTFALLATTAALVADARPQVPLGAARGVALVAVLWIWNQVHGGFAYGYATLGCLLLGDAVQGWRADRRVPRRCLELLGVAGLGALGWFAHPQGLASVEHVLRYPGRLGLQFERVGELRAFGGLDDPLLLVFVLGLAGTLAACASRRGAGLRGGELLVSLLFWTLAFKTRRALIPALVLSAPWVAARLSQALPVAWLARRLEATARSLPPALALTAALWLAWAVPGRSVAHAVPGDMGHGAWSRVVFPCEGANALRSLGGERRILNLYSAGGLLDWGLYPQRRLVVDGRGDLHGRGTAYEDYARVVDLAPGWQAIVDRWGVSFALLPAGTPLVAALRDAGWVVRHADPQRPGYVAWVVLERA